MNYYNKKLEADKKTERARAQKIQARQKRDALLTGMILGCLLGLGFGWIGILSGAVLGLIVGWIA